MNFNTTLHEAVQAIDIARIAQHMRETNWKWMNDVTNHENRVPTEREIEEFVAGRVASFEAHDGINYAIMTGGFTFRRSGDTCEITFDFGRGAPAPASGAD